MKGDLDLSGSMGQGVPYWGFIRELQVACWNRPAWRWLQFIFLADTTLKILMRCRKGKLFWETLQSITECYTDWYKSYGKEIWIAINCWGFTLLNCSTKLKVAILQVQLSNQQLFSLTLYTLCLGIQLFVFVSTA